MYGMDHDLNCSLLFCKFGPGTGEYANQVSVVLLGNSSGVYVCMHLYNNTSVASYILT